MPYGARAPHTVVAVVLALMASGPAVAQQPGVQRAIDLERQNRHREAAAVFERLLDDAPGNLQALFGLERTLRELGAVERILPRLDSAVGAVADPGPVFSLKLRVLGTLGRLAEIAQVAETWIAAAPERADPYREWAFAVAQRGDVAEARRILGLGHDRLGGAALMQELAQVDVVAGDWVSAARHWTVAARANEGIVAAAGLSLAQTPPRTRDAVMDLLLRTLGDPLARRIAADLLVQWDRPAEAWAVLDPVLPDQPALAVATLRRFVDRARRTPARQSLLVQGYALERLAELSVGSQAQQARVDAARAYADAGNREAAERMLADIARDSAAAPVAAARAMATLIAVAADAGRVDEAEERFRSWGPRLSVDDVESLRQRIAWARIRRGELDRALHVLADDSTVRDAATRGWVALFRGDLAGATDGFRRAGPYGESREQTTRRTAMLALIQRIAPDTVPALGAALLTLERGDSAAAVERLQAVARGLPPAGGRADLLAFAGRVLWRMGKAEAESLLETAVVADPNGPAAPAALLLLARAAERAGRPDTAMRRLEDLILKYPDSAVVPEARRLLDQLRGAIPRS